MRVLEQREISDISLIKYRKFDPVKYFSDLTMIFFMFIKTISKHLVEELYPFILLFAW